MQGDDVPVDGGNDHGIDGHAANPNPDTYLSPNIDIDAPLQTESPGNGSANTSARSVVGKFVLQLDCLVLLKPDQARPGIYLPKSAEEAATDLHLSTLIAVPILDEIKIKMIHTCGPIEFEEGRCLVALRSVGAWLVNQYRQIGKTARSETLVYDETKEWDEPDAVLEVYID